MWVGYVARSHQVAPAALLAALGLPTDVRDRRPVGEIAREQNKRFADIRALLEAAIAEESGRPLKPLPWDRSRRCRNSSSPSSRTMAR